MCAMKHVTNGPNPTLVQRAANGSKEPVLTDAAPRTNDGFGNLSAPIHCKGKRHLRTEHGDDGNFDRLWQLGR